MGISLRQKLALTFLLKRYIVGAYYLNKLNALIGT